MNSRINCFEQCFYIKAGMYFSVLLRQEVWEAGLSVLARSFLMESNILFYFRSSACNCILCSIYVWYRGSGKQFFIELVSNKFKSMYLHHKFDIIHRE